MGLIKTGIKYGALFGIAREGMKAIDRHDSRTPPQQQQPPVNQQLYMQAPAQRSMVDEYGYAHQSWCNQSCGRQCNAAANQSHMQAAPRGFNDYGNGYGNSYGGEAPPAYQGQGSRAPVADRRYLGDEKKAAMI